MIPMNYISVVFENLFEGSKVFQILPNAKNQSKYRRKHKQTSQMRISLSLSLHLHVAAATAGAADPSVHLPVVLGTRWGREAPGGGRCAVAQRMPRSRALLVHRGPPFVCISAELLTAVYSLRKRGKED